MAATRERLRFNLVEFKADDMDNSSPDEGYETPAKKVCSTSLFEDLRNLINTCRPPARKELVSPVTISEPPSSTCTTGGISDDVKSCQSPSSNLLQATPVSNKTVERGNGLAEDDRLEPKVKDEDGGYFSMSYMKDVQTGKDPSQMVDPELPLASSCLPPKKGEVRTPEDECDPESASPEQVCQTEAALCDQHVSSTTHDLCPVAYGPLLDSGNVPGETLEDDPTEMWSIGVPLFESSICESERVQIDACSDQKRPVCEDLGATKESKCETILSEVDTSYENTLPLQVQVKSVVVVLGQHKKSVEPSLPKQTETSKPSLTGNRTRLADLECEKKKYFQLVARHLNEPPGTNQGVMSELLNLMTRVADQRPGTDGRQWQHPSDLTCRNYQQRFGNCTLTLSEWKGRNNPRLKRFGKVPKIFTRSPFP